MLHDPPDYQTCAKLPSPDRILPRQRGKELVSRIKRQDSVVKRGSGMTIRNEDVNTIAGGGGDVRTSSGDKIGSIVQLYLDDETGRPSWVTVKTGLFGAQESFVPLAGADLSGINVVVPYDKDTIKGAPRVETGGSLTPDEERRLYSYYFDAQTIETARATGADTRDEDVPRASRDDRSDLGNDSDDVRSAERADRDTDRSAERADRDNDRSDRDGIDDDQRRGSDPGNEKLGDDKIGTPRLRRYVVTERVIPVSREEVPVDDPDRG
jgi:hypothetical protein